MSISAYVKWRVAWISRAMGHAPKTNGQLRAAKRDAQLSRRSARLQLLHLRYIANVIAPRRRDARPFVTASLVPLAVGPCAVDERDQRARALSCGMRSTDQLDKNTHPSVPLRKDREALRAVIDVVIHRLEA